MSGTVGRIVSGIGDVLFGRLLLVFVLGIPVLGVTFLLTGGTGLLVSVGLSRNIAGSLTAGLAIVGCIAGLGAFAKYGIDWS